MHLWKVRFRKTRNVWNSCYHGLCGTIIRLKSFYIQLRQKIAASVSDIQKGVCVWMGTIFGIKLWEYVCQIFPIHISNRYFRGSILPAVNIIGQYIFASHSLQGLFFYSKAPSLRKLRRQILPIFDVIHMICTKTFFTSNDLANIFTAQR